MGKTLIQQARGRGKMRYRAPSFRYLGETKHPAVSASTPLTGTVRDIVKSQGHNAPLLDVAYDNNTTALLPAPEGVRIGQTITHGPSAPIENGSTLALREIPEGTNVFNVELRPGDGGRLCRTTGTFAKVLSKIPAGVVVILPSKKQTVLSPDCRATIGIVAGSGRPEKPFLKAGNRWWLKRTKNKRYPMISAAAQNAVDHPFGNKRTSRKAKNKPMSRHAPAGRKVGKISPRRTGRKK